MESYAELSVTMLWTSRLANHGDVID